MRWIQEVGLPGDLAERPALELSGGQRQRIAIARALTLNPEMIVFDEAFSGLDLPVQAHILELLRTLRSQYNLTYIFVSHDLSLVARICNDVAVMYGGRIVEKASVEEFLASPVHDYSQKLVQAIPRLTSEYLA